MPSSGAETSLAQMVMSLLLNLSRTFSRDMGGSFSTVFVTVRGGKLVPCSPLIPLLGKSLLPLPLRTL